MTPREWHTIWTDRLTLEGSENLVVADHYSKYPFARQIPSGQSNINTVIQMLSERGIPKVVRSDNGPHYSGQAFQEFTRERGFQHVTSSPHYRRSNSFIEKQVKSVKAGHLKAKPTHSDPDMALLCLRTPTTDPKLPSPAELFLGRVIQDLDQRIVV